MKRVLLSAAVVFTSSFAAYAMDTFIVKEGSLSVAETIQKLETIIEAAPPTLMAKVDHGAGAKKAGMDLGESVLLILGAPKIGTPMMQSNRLVGLDLPAKILVYNEDGKTKIAYTSPQALKKRYAVTGADEQIKAMAGALDKFTEAARQ